MVKYTSTSLNFYVSMTKNYTYNSLNLYLDLSKLILH